LCGEIVMRILQAASDVNGNYGRTEHIYYIQIKSGAANRCGATPASAPKT